MHSYRLIPLYCINSFNSFFAVILFSTFSYLRESGKAKDDPKVNDKEYKKMSEEGRALAQNLLPKLGQWTGQTLTVDELKEQVQKEKASKVSN